MKIKGFVRYHRAGCKGASEQSSAVDSTNSMAERLSQSINGVVKIPKN